VARNREADGYRGAGEMTRKYSLAIEGESGSYSAYVPELPTILVTGESLDELTLRASEAIRLYWTSVRTDLSPTSMLREIEVELPV
jgi:predicted RNase H-like HicB family nuclease